MDNQSGRTSGGVSKEEWQKYHTAWQQYYQKYYSEYYAKAARIYVSKKIAKQKEEAENQIPERPTTIISSKPDEETELTPVQRLARDLKQKIQLKASDEAARKERIRRFAPLIAGASVALLILFLQYNRMIFAPIAAYVSPGNTSDNGITAIDGTISTAVGEDNRLMIPKLNVDVPIAFGIPNDTDTVNEAMNHGVAQFAIPGASAMPGQVGNLVITGHSAGDIYSNNQYKFIFSGLERLTENDLIYIDYQGTRYTYSITKFETVEPTNVQALVYETDKPILTLITCTPLGTSRYRLLVTAEQISPSPSGATMPEEEQGAVEDNDMMPKNEATLFESVWGFVTGD